MDAGDGEVSNVPMPVSRFPDTAASASKYAISGPSNSTALSDALF